MMLAALRCVGWAAGGEPRGAPRSCGLQQHKTSKKARAGSVGGSLLPRCQSSSVVYGSLFAV